MKNYYLIYILLLLNILIGQTEYLRFNHLTNADGLSESTVFDIYQDKDGFIWFATDNGLDRYDGLKFHHYKHNPKNDNSLLSDRVQTIFKDNNKNLWIGGQNTGLSKYNDQDGIYTHFKMRDYLNDTSLIKKQEENF